MPLLTAKAKHRVTIVLNGVHRSGYAEPRLLLTDFLRHELGATGTHVGCEHGVCGACTVQLEGEPVRACLTLAVQVDGLRVDTVEGLSDRSAQHAACGTAPTDTGLSPLQRCFKKHHALQCGFCTAGILMTLDAYLKSNPDPTEAQLRDILSGHLCRCTGYTGIVKAALEAAAMRTAINPTVGPDVNPHGAKE